MKRSLVFYRGKPPTGSKTDWVMHEYRLAGAGLAPCRRAGVGAVWGAAERPAEGWALCRMFRKKGSASANAAAADPGSDGEAEEAEEQQEEEVGAAGGARAFIDFFARADAVAAGRREQQQQGQQQRRASSPVVSSSCLTDASHEQHGREQETTSRGA